MAEKSDRWYNTRAQDYTALEALYNSTPEELQDPEAFYTPELQEAVLAQLTQQVLDSRDQNQATISGGAIQSGFGVGGSSREMARRAQADAQALDEIVQGSVRQAAAIEDMRQMQREDEEARRLGVEEDRKNRQQAFDLAKRGYAYDVSSAKQAIMEDERNQRREAVMQGITDLTGGFVGLLGSNGQPTGAGSTSAPFVGLNTPISSGLYKPKNFWETQDPFKR